MVNDETLMRAAAILRNGGLAAFPTETVYGLGADAFNAAALARVFEVKERPRFDPLIVHIASLDTLEKIANLSLLNQAARKQLHLLAEKLWPGPLTLVLPKREAVPGLVTGGLSTVAIRIPGHPAARRLISLSTGAIAAPSANPFGYLSPTRAEHVQDQLGEKVDIILDGGPSPVGVESTVLDISGIQPRILRPGGTPKETIEAVTGPVLSGPENGAAAGSKKNAANAGPPDPRSPGQLKSHYAPRTPLSVHSREALITIPGENDSAFLFFDGPSRDMWRGNNHHSARLPAETRVLSETGNLLEAAACLFETLHNLDKTGIARIYAQYAPDNGLGAAINDRLTRAAYRPVPVTVS
jgi:L-threonylcarbamoyladenylate synthase